MIKQIIKSGFLLLIAANCSFAQMTLKQAVSRALAVSNSIKSSELALVAQKSKVSSAYGRLYPNISVDFFYTYMNDDIILDLDPIRKVIIELQSGNMTGFANIENMLKKGAPLSEQEQLLYKKGASAQLEQKIPHFKETIKEQAFPQMLVSINQPIYTGGKIIAGIKAAELQENIEQKRSEAEIDEISDEVIRLCLNYWLAKENTRIRQEVAEGIGKHLERARKLFEQGIIPKNDRLRAEVALSEAERNLFEAREKEKIIIAALAVALDTTEESIEINDTMIYKQRLLSVNDYMLFAKSNNKKLEQVRLAEKALGQKENAKFAEYMPQVFAYGFYNVLDNYMADIEPKWGVGIGAHFTVFDGLRRTNEYQEASLEKQSMLMKLKDAEKKIELLVRSKYMEMKLAEEKFLQLDNAIEQTNENLRLYEKRYETGLGTTLEVIDARLALEAVSLKRVQALTEFYINMSSLSAVCGNIDSFVNFISEN